MATRATASSARTTTSCGRAGATTARSTSRRTGGRRARASTRTSSRRASRATWTRSNGSGSPPTSRRSTRSATRRRSRRSTAAAVLGSRKAHADPRPHAPRAHAARPAANGCGRGARDPALRALPPNLGGHDGNSLADARASGHERHPRRHQRSGLHRRWRSSRWPSEADGARRGAMGKTRRRGDRPAAAAAEIGQTEQLRDRRPRPRAARRPGRRPRRPAAGQSPFAAREENPKTARIGRTAVAKPTLVDRLGITRQAAACAKHGRRKRLHSCRGAVGRSASARVSRPGSAAPRAWRAHADGELTRAAAVPPLPLQRGRQYRCRARKQDGASM